MSFSSPSCTSHWFLLKLPSRGLIAINQFASILAAPGRSFVATSVNPPRPRPARARALGSRRIYLTGLYPRGVSTAIRWRQSATGPCNQGPGKMQKEIAQARGRRASVLGQPPRPSLSGGLRFVRVGTKSPTPVPGMCGPVPLPPC